MVTNIHLPSPRGTFNLVKNKKPLSFLLFGNCFGNILCLNYNINPVVSVHKNCSSLGTRTGFLVGFYYINSLGALKSTELSRYGSLLCLTWSTVWRLARTKSGLFWKVQENRRSSNEYKLVCRKFGFDIWIFFFTGREVKTLDQEPTETVVSIISSVKTPYGQGSAQPHLIGAALCRWSLSPSQPELFCDFVINTENNGKGTAA